MCIIAISEKRKLTEKEFTNCYENNPDGAGFAYIDNGKKYYKKGFMTLKEAWNFYQKEINIFPHVSHFRIGTSGDKCKKLTHPFIISNESELLLEYKGENDLLFHNGIISNWKDLLVQNCISLKTFPEDENISDTRVLAISLSLVKNNKKLLDYFNGKFVLLSDKIYKYGDFEENKGILFSNKAYSYGKYIPVINNSNFFEYKNAYSDRRYLKLKSKEIEKEDEDWLDKIDMDSGYNFNLKD
jgi:predicted glutamine amidotransferase